MSRKYTAVAVISGVIAMLAVAALASISFSTAAFAQGNNAPGFHQKEIK